MAQTTAQIKQLRLKQAKAVRAAIRTLDSAQEALERKVLGMTRKRKMIEPSDVLVIGQMYRAMVGTMNGVESEINRLGTLVNA
jgi:hypothetical protein